MARPGDAAAPPGAPGGRGAGAEVEPDERLVAVPTPVGGVRVWQTRLVPAPGDEAAARLGAADLARLASAPPDAADRLVARRVLLRRAVAAWCGGDPARVRPLLGPGPRRVRAPDGRVLCTSATSGGAAGLLVLAEQPVGVDLEPLPGPPDAREVAAALLPPPERDWVLAGGDGLPDRLLAVWVRKEAVVKATGEGLSRDLASFVVDPVRDGAPVGGDELAALRLRTWGLRVPGHAAALALGHDGAPAPGR